MDELNDAKQLNDLDYTFIDELLDLCEEVNKCVNKEVNERDVRFDQANLYNIIDLEYQILNKMLTHLCGVIKCEVSTVLQIFKNDININISKPIVIRLLKKQLIQHMKTTKLTRHLNKAYS